jgi:hypothetical protein
VEGRTSTRSYEEMSSDTEPRERGCIDEQRLIQQWRREQFRVMGFAPAEARRLTAASVDLGDMRRLLAAGCPPETARRILA